MGTKTIHSLAYKLFVDSQGFEKGMIASRKELGHAKREMRSMLTPSEKMEVSLKKLGDLAQKDARFQAVYNRKLMEYRRELIKTDRQTTLYGKTLDKLGTRFLSRAAIIGAATGALAASTALASRVFFRNMNRLDGLSKAADKTGSSTEFLSRLQFIASQTSGLSDEQTLKGIEKFTRRVSEAAAGAGEAQGVIKELGLDAQRLAASGPEKAFNEVARAMDKVVNEHDRLRIATKLFDDEQAGIHTTLRLSTAEFNAQGDAADRLGRTVRTFDAEQMVRAKDSIAEMNAAFQSFGTKFAVTVGPAVLQMTRELTRTLDKLNAASGSRDNGTGFQLDGPRDFNALAKTTTGDYLSTFYRSTSESFRTIKSANDLYFIRLLTDFKDVRSERINADIAARTRQRERMAVANEERIAANEAAIAKAKKEQMERAEKERKEINEAAKKHWARFGDSFNSLFGKRDGTGKVKTGILMPGFALGLPDGSGRMTERGMVSKGIERLFTGTESMLRDTLGSIKIRQQGEEQFMKERFDPMESIAAGTSEAFRIQYQTTATRSVEVEIAKSSDEKLGNVVSLLDDIRSKFAGTRESEDLF